MEKMKKNPFLHFRPSKVDLGELLRSLDLCVLQFRTKGHGALLRLERLHEESMVG